MQNVTISIPPELLDYANEQVAQSEVANLSELFCLLLREDRAALERLQDAIAEGEASGISEHTPEEIVERARERYRSRAA